MAQSPKKPAAAKAAKPAAASASAPAAANKDGLAIVHLPKNADGPSGTVAVGVNGRVHHIAVGSDVPVSAEVAEALANSGHDVTTVSPAKGEGAAAGSAASSTVTGTAVRGEVDDLAGSNPGEPAHELSQVADAEIVKQSQGAGDSPPSTKPGA